MKQIIISKYGAPDVLKVVKKENPKPKSNEIRIRNYFSGVNFSEVMARMKLYPRAPKPPSGIGSECCGIIDDIGSNVKKFKIGDKIMAFSKFQSYASYVCIEENLAMKLPNNFSLKQGAAFPVVYITAYRMLFDLGNLRQKDTILIHGGGGGVGTASIQIAKSIKSNIITTASSWKHKKLIDMGVDLCIDYKKHDFVSKVKEFTNGKGVDIIIDPIGAKNWKKSYNCLASMGKLIIFGDQDLVSGYKLNITNAFKELLSMPKYKPLSLMSSNKSIMGYHLGRMVNAERQFKRSIQELNKLVNKEKVTPIIDKIFNYKDSPNAHKYMQERKNFGKILIDFSSCHN